MSTTKPIRSLDKVPGLPAVERVSAQAVARQFAFRATEYYLALIDWSDPADPIRRIVMPSASELQEFGDWDPSLESENYVATGCQHKYPETALLMVSDVCDAYCRFCFRKRLFQSDTPETSLDVAAGLAYIARHPEINGVLLTGGDPLVLSTRRLQHILAGLRQIPHVRTIRLGTKALAFNPMRVLDDADLRSVLARFTGDDRRIYVMAHFDHPRELTPQALRAAALLQESGCILVHQCPLLRGINDRPDVLAELLDGVAAAGIAPYYIFQNRPVLGNAGFVVPLAEGYSVVEAAKRRVSGLARRFKYVMSHATGKVEILAVAEGRIYLKYHQARHPADAGRFFHCELPSAAAWLDDLPTAQGAPAGPAAATRQET